MFPAIHTLLNSSSRLILAACGVALSLSTTAVAEPTKGEYPEPRFPQFLVNPSAEQLMDAARLAVRQTGGLGALGNAQPGQTVHVFLHYSQDMEVWDAIQKAWAERNVKAVGIRGWEAFGMSQDEYEKQARENLITGGEGWKEMGMFEPLYVQFFPEDIQKSFGKPMTVLYSYLKYKEYLDKHPEVKHLFVGSGGGKGFWGMFAGPEHKEKFLGNWIFVTKNELLSNLASFPPDVWKMLDEEIVRPIPHVAEGTFQDPEGTDLHWVQTPQESQIWEERSGLTSYSPGHLNIYPPPQHALWKKRVITAAGNHTAFMPPMTVHISERGRVTSVEGGGKAGDLFRMLVNHPKLKTLKFPTAPEEGYWYLAQDGLGTNPKAVRNMYDLAEGTVDLPNLTERHRAGVQHFSFSSAPGFGFGTDPRDEAYAKEMNVPLRHTAHMHVYFGTAKWKLRDTGEWMTVIDKGRLGALDNPEVRALAAKYGDPDVLFSYDWVPHIPGINAPGDYKRDYAKDPWAHILKVWNKIKDGSYEHYVRSYDMFGGS